MYTPSSFSTFGKYDEDKYESGGGIFYEPSMEINLM
jgi:hypothetical protein